MSGYWFLSFAAVLLCLGSTYATAEEEAKLQEAFHPFVMKCAEKYGITEEQFEEAKKKRSIKGIDPCFVSCVLKESELVKKNIVKKPACLREISRWHVKPNQRPKGGHKSSDTSQPAIMALVTEPKYRELKIMNNHGRYPFDSAGKFDVRKTKKFMKSHLESESAVLFMETVCSECAKVNDEEVTDDDEGCDRAKKMWSCMKEVKEKLQGAD